MAVTLFQGMRVSSRADAAELLRPFRDDPVALRDLRHVATERYPSLDVSALDDDEVLELVARSMMGLLWELDETTHGRELSHDEVLDVLSRREEAVGEALAGSLARDLETGEELPLAPELPAELVVKVVDKADETRFLPHVKVTLTLPEPAAPAVRTTDANSSTGFGLMKPGSYKVSITFDQKDDVRYRLDTGDPIEQDVTLAADEKKTVVFKLVPIVRVYVDVGFLDPKGERRHLPKGFKVQLALTTGGTVEAVLGDGGVLHDKPDGNPYVELDRVKKGFKLEFKQPKQAFVVCEKPGDAAKTEEYLENDAPTAADAELKGELQKRADEKKRFFMLPKDGWNLESADWEIRGAIAFARDTFERLEQLAIKVGTASTPVQATLAPRWLKARFEFFDRCFGYDHHGEQRVGIPPITLRGARSGPAGAAAAYDAVSNWTIDDDSPESACQCLPFVITKKDGTNLPRLDKDLLLEFQAEKRYVVSKSATEREIQKLDPAGTDRDKLKPNPDRTKYYDLPKVWKSTNYYTRLAPGTGKLFYDLTSDEIEAAFAATPLTFSLDDIVLVKADGLAQNVKDKGATDAVDEDLSDKSRLTVLYLDPAHHRVKIDRSRTPRARYHSNIEFVKDAGGAWRNVIVDATVYARAVVFCSGFYDVFDKRTTTADFGQKEILGARAAKLNDASVSAMRAINGYTNADKQPAYTCDGAGRHDLHYLHYGATVPSTDTNAGTVHGALVTYWSGRFFFAPGDAPAGWGDASGVDGSVDDKRNYIQSGLWNAMERWNAKGYRLEQHDGKTEVVIQTFSLFEAKEFESPPGSGTFVKRGGTNMCNSSLTTNDKTSWMGETKANLRRSGYDGEGEARGSLPATEVRAKDYSGHRAPPRLAVAHELGHSSGLDDDYVYYVDGIANLVRYAQYYPGMPYSVDTCALMKSNQAIRLRYWWGRVNWVNDKAASDLNAFLGGKLFDITYSLPLKKLVFKLIDPVQATYHDPAQSKYRNIYKPAYTQDNYALERSGRCDLHLYKLGHDELSATLRGGPYDGMLVVAIKISHLFKDGGITKWAAATLYHLDDIVEEKGKKYICLREHTSMAHFKDNRLRWEQIADVSPWATPELYEVGATVLHGDHLYRCTGKHTSRASRAKDWFKWSHLGKVHVWAATTKYRKGDIVSVTTGAPAVTKYFKCGLGHRSSVAFETDTNRWREIRLRGDWADNTEYDVADVVTRAGMHLYCMKAHTSATSPSSNAAFLRLNDRGDWHAARHYVVKDRVKKNGKFYVCKNAHDSVDFAAETGKWIETKNRGAWARDTRYDIGDVVTDAGGDYYFSNAEHASYTHASRTGWDEVNHGSTSWSREQKKDWLNDLEKTFALLLERPKGKFKLQSADNAEFARIYVRAFLQFDAFRDAATARAAGTHFEIEVTKDEKLTFAPEGPAGTKIAVGSHCSARTIARYLLGLLSLDPNVRANESRTADLKKDDLAKLSDWVHDKAGGTFTVETL